MRIPTTRTRWIVLTAAAAIGLTATAAIAASSSFFVQGLLQGYGPLGETVNVEIYEYSLSRGNVTGYHTHPGPTFVVVSKGTVVEDDGCDTPTEHVAGSAFYEPTGAIHNVRAADGEVVKLYIMQVVPLGVPDITYVDTPTCGN